MSGDTKHIRNAAEGLGPRASRRQFLQGVAGVGAAVTGLASAPDVSHVLQLRPRSPLRMLWLPRFLSSVISDPGRWTPASDPPS